MCTLTREGVTTHNCHAWLIALLKTSQVKNMLIVHIEDDDE